MILLVISHLVLEEEENQEQFKSSSNLQLKLKCKVELSAILQNTPTPLTLRA